MATYYHVTPHTRTLKILQQGLLPGKRRQWKNSFGATLGDRRKLYLFSDFDVAIQFAARMEWEFERPIDILRLELNRTDFEADSHIESQMQAGKWWTTTMPIPRDAIEEVIPLTLEMKRDFIRRRNAGAANGV